MGYQSAIFIVRPTTLTVQKMVLCIRNPTVELFESTLVASFNLGKIGPKPDCFRDRRSEYCIHPVGLGLPGNMGDDSSRHIVFTDGYGSWFTQASLSEFVEWMGQQELGEDLKALYGYLLTLNNLNPELVVLHGGY